MPATKKLLCIDRGGARKVPTGGLMPPTGGLTILVPENQYSFRDC